MAQKSEHEKNDNLADSSSTDTSKKSDFNIYLDLQRLEKKISQNEYSDTYLEIEEDPIRGHWTGKFDYVISTLGYTVGLGNVWRFPYMCFKFGGGTFLYLSLLFLILLGIPMFLVDVSIGQFSSNGPFTCWEYAPLFTGIGYAMVTISTIVAVYYNVIIGYSIYYIISSVVLPWQDCNNAWNTENCIYKLPIVNCSLYNAYANGTCMDDNQIFLGLWNTSLFTQVTNRTRVLAADEYLNGDVLSISDGITDTGRIQWRLALSLLAAWLLVFGCLFNAKKASGKAAYFTAVFPYICLVVLFFRGIILDGAVDGMLQYIVPDLTKFYNPSVWKEAACQVFFSLSLNWGGLMSLSSYNRFHDNILRDTIAISLINIVTSVLVGFTIFCYLGFLAKLLNKSMETMADQGMGLAFIIFPEAVARLNGCYLFSALFFVMILTMGISSQCITVETLITGFIDLFPGFLRTRRRLLLAFTCIVLYLLGLPMCFQSGPYWLQLMDSYCGGWAILLIAICEVISISWIYGRPGLSWSNPMRFTRDLETMLQRPISGWWRLCFQYITPIIMIGIMIFSWKDYKRSSYGTIPYPIWADFLGWMMTMFSLSFIPGTIIFLVAKEKISNSNNSFLLILYNLTLPTYKWGPCLPKFRMLVAEQLEDNENIYIDVGRRIKYKDIIAKTNKSNWSKY